MPISLNAIAVLGLFSVPITACAISTTGAVGGGNQVAGVPRSPGTGDAVGEPAVQALPVGTPAMASQFTPVAEADWSIDKPIVGSEITCRDGRIRVFTCQAVELLAFLPVDSIGGGELSDIWGWTDSLTGREFALVGRTTGTSFVEITDPLNPRYLGQLPYHVGAKPSLWRDIKVYQHHAFIVSDVAGPHGMQVFDLAQLRHVSGAPVTFRETTHYSRINSAHNIVISEATGFAYTAGNSDGGETCGGGLHMIDIRNPIQPTFAGCYAEPRTGRKRTGYVHDAQCVIYRGPDQQYRGREICLNSAETAVSITDVTEKARPKTISIAEYPDAGYTHQGWLSHDQRYFFLGDENDKLLLIRSRGKGNTRTMVFDLADLDDPILLTEFFGTGTATDHNLYVRGRYMYQSNYRDGLRIIDVHDPENLKEVGYFYFSTDDQPSGDQSPSFSSWSNYPYFTNQADVVVFTGGKQGLFVVRYRADRSVTR